jgi:hypothetical protein
MLIKYYSVFGYVTRRISSLCQECNGSLLCYLYTLIYFDHSYTETSLLGGHCETPFVPRRSWTFITSDIAMQWTFCSFDASNNSFPYVS